MSKKAARIAGGSTFQQAVQNTPDISSCYHRGLQALGSDSQKITLGNNSECSGSVYIDACTKANRENEARWDYVFCYKNAAIFVEVHPADTSQVSKMLEKLAWLKAWLAKEAPQIQALRAKDDPYYWIASKGVHLLPGSPQYNRAAQAKLLPKSHLQLK